VPKMQKVSIIKLLITTKTQNHHCNSNHTTMVERKRVITRPGFSLSFLLTSTISPEIGEFISLDAFTLSTAPNPEFFDTETPGSGSSKYTTSPRWSCN